MSEINWAKAPHLPSHYEARQELFYKVSCDRERLYVFDEGKWSTSKHSVETLFKYDKPFTNPLFEQEITAITNSELPPLKLWCAMGKGRNMALANFVGVSSGFISRICTGDKKLPIDILQQVSDFTGIHAKFLAPDLAKIFGVTDKELINIDRKEYQELVAFKKRIMG